MLDAVPSDESAQSDPAAAQWVANPYSRAVKN
jgi:hypothetical protein